MMDHTESALSAEQAVQVLLAKQQEDLDSFKIRTGLHLANLEKARRKPSSGDKMEATVNMVKSFLGSANLFRVKWAKQLTHLKDSYPESAESPSESLFAQLESLPEGLADAEQEIEAALASL